MFDLTNATVRELIIHYVGNKENGQDLLLAKQPIELEDEKVRQLVMKCFIDQFKVEELFRITHSTGNYTLNPVFQILSSIFSGDEDFVSKTRELAKHLYQVTAHPNIKSGELFIIRFDDVTFDNHKTEALGIFKADVKEEVLVTSYDNNRINLLLQEGINNKTLDKGVLFFKHLPEEGYRCLVIDKTNKSFDAKFWKETFLGVEAISTSFSETRDFISICKDFISDVLPAQEDISKTNQIVLLRNSLTYMEENEEINIGQFKKEVFQNKFQETAFDNYMGTISESRNTTFNETFQVSDQAFNKFSRKIRSVLKLDKNFHVYIHGDSELIENGYDNEKKMKYYKIYYSEEK
jgi:hypothetical protein